MKLGAVFRFEVAYRLRQPSTWGYGALLTGIPFLLLHAVDGTNVQLNAPEMVASASAVIGMFGMVASAALFGDAAARDVQTRMHSLFYTAPLRERDYLGGRFLGALAVNALLLLGVPLGLLAASLMPYMAAGKFGPPRPAAYVHAYLLLLLPNMAVSGAMLFAIAARVRSVLATYLGGIALFIGWSIAGELSDGLTDRTLAGLVDPFGVRALEDLTRYWTVAERNVRMIGFPTLLVWNRLLWLAASLAVAAVSLGSFRFVHQGGEARRRWRRARPADAAGSAPPAARAPGPALARAFGLRTRLAQTLAVARRAFREVAVNRVFAVLLAGTLAFVFVFGWDVGDNVFGTSLWPVTHLVAGTVLSDAITPIMAVLLALFAGEMVWRERDVRMGDIANVSPVPDWVALVGRYLALAALVVVLQAVLMAEGVLLQAIQGYHHHELGVYVQLLFGLKLADYLLFAALAMAVHVLVDQKYVGHAIVVAYYVFTTLAERFGIRHHLLVYGSDPGWVYSDMNGLGPFVAPFVWFKLYWAAWALLFAVLTRLFWIRGPERDVRARLRLARRRFVGSAVGAASVAGALILSLGGFVFYNTNVLHEHRAPEAAAALRAEYERRFRRFEDAPQPHVTAAALRVEIFPEEPAAEVRGSYRLVNATARAIDSVHVLLGQDARTRAVRLDRPARLVLDAPRLRYRIYALETPLLPGDSLRLTFDVAYRPQGFPNADVPTEVTGNAAYFDRGWLPVVGYQPARELAGASERREQGLPPARAVPSADDSIARRSRVVVRDADLVDVETVIGTSPSQIAVAPGTLQREWRENGRRYFRYRTETPLPFAAPVLSAEYAVREGRWHDVALKVYHHPTHTVNVDRMLRGMRAALAYNSAHFGPYQFRELRVVEFPRYANFARAHPHTIAFSEGGSFLTRVDSGDVDRTYFVTAHETAHQWWGGQLMPARVRGAALLSETLAQYSAMMAMESELGREQVRRFYYYEIGHYLGGRRAYASREVPLLDVEDQDYLYYHKGAVAMYALRERIGADAVNGALRRFLARHRDAGPPYPTSRDLYAELRAVTPDSLHPMLRDLFEDIVLWDVRADSVRVEPVGGAFRVTLDVTAAKARADSVGVESPLPMDEAVEIGVFAGAATDGGGPGEPLYVGWHRVRTGRQRIVVTVPRAPLRAGIDPYFRLIDRERRDNVRKVATSGAPSRD